VGVVAPKNWQLRLLLCAHRQRPRRRRAADQRDELAPPHIGSQAQESALYPLKQVL
jgi:hypothetical protein